MTISSSISTSGPFTGNGVNTTYSFGFKVFLDSDIGVIETIGGVETTLTLNSDYSVALNADQESSPGGIVTYPLAGSPMASTSTLLIKRDVPYTQGTDLISGGGWNPEAVEDSFDKQCMLSQQLLEAMQRSLKVPISSYPAVSPTLPAPIAFNLLRWDAAATALENISTSDFTNITGLNGWLVENFSGDGATTAFDLSQDAGNENNTQIHISGAYQSKDEYTVSGTTITFSVAPATGTDNIEVVYPGTAPLGAIDAADVTYVPEYPGYVVRNVQDKLRESVSASDFGAYGLGLVDEVTQLQAAIDALEAVSGTAGGDLILDGPNYLVSEQLTCSKPLRIYGRGSLSDTASSSGLLGSPTTIKYTGASAEAILRIISGTANNFLHRGAVKGILFNGNDVATQAIHASSIVEWDIDVQVWQVTTDAVLVDDANNALSGHNDIRLWFVWGVNAASQGANGLTIHASIAGKGAPQNRVWTRGLIYDGDMVSLKGCDNTVCHHLMGFTQSGGTGVTLNTLASAVAASRNHLINYLVGDVTVDATSYGSRILHTTSEGQTITIASGGQIHYEVADYSNGEVWATHKFKMSDKFLITPGMMEPDGTFAVVGTMASLWRTIQYSNASNGWASVQIPQIPGWSDGNIVSIEFNFSADGTTAGNAVFQIRAHTPGQLANIATPTYNENATVAVNGTVHVNNIRTHTLVTPIAYSYGDSLLLRIDRISNDAADTNTDDLFLIGITLNYEGEGPDSAGSGPYAIPPVGV